MLSPKLILIVRTAIYALILICSFVIFSPLSISLTTHGGSCILYAHVNIDRYKSRYGPKSVCNYSIAIAGIFCLLYPCIILILMVLTLIGKLKDLLINFSGLPFLIMVIIETVILVLVLISGCTISVGLKTLCRSLEDFVAVPCSQTYIIPGIAPDSQDYFYKTIAAAEGGAWTSFMLWLVQVVIGFLLLWRNGRLPCSTECSRPRSKPVSKTTQEEMTKY